MDDLIFLSGDKETIEVPSELAPIIKLLCLKVAADSPDDPVDRPSSGAVSLLYASVGALNRNIAEHKEFLADYAEAPQVERDAIESTQYPSGTLMGDCAGILCSTIHLLLLGDASQSIEPIGRYSMEDAKGALHDILCEIYGCPLDADDIAEPCGPSDWGYAISFVDDGTKGFTAYVTVRCFGDDKEFNFYVKNDISVIEFNAAFEEATAFLG